MSGKITPKYTEEFKHIKRTKLFVIIILLFIIIFFVLFLCYGDTLFRVFKKKENLNYDNITRIDFIPGHSTDVGVIHIKNKDDIEKIINCLNSLDLIKEKKPNYNFKSNNDLNEIGHFIIKLYGASYDSIVFTTEYLTICLNGYDWENVSYYILNSGYNPEDKTSNFYNFLRKYIEE